MVEDSQKRWCLDLEDPLKGRLNKPRDKGLTMVLDKGLGITALKDLLDIAGEYIDFLKFSFGTSLIYPSSILKEKIKMVLKRGIDVYPGGTLFEIAVVQKRLNEFLFRAKQLGFSAIEVSNGTIDLPEKLRNEVIYKANSLGFKVLTEVGKKDRQQSLTLDEMKEQIKEDIDAGAHKIIIEGRESGKDISIYQEDGSIEMEMLEGILLATQGNEDIIIWEAPLKKQQVTFIQELGPNVNLGNVKTGEIIALEALRRGLRGDTFKITLENEEGFIKKGSQVGA